jgi:glucose/arabinose dehydrogenase
MKNYYLLIILVVISAFNTTAQNPVLSLQSFSSGYSNPVDIENCGDNRLFIVERTGKIWICDANGNKKANPFLDITSKVFSAGSEQGLLGLAFHPDYKSNGFFYVNYISNKQRTVIARYKVNAVDSNKAKINSETKLLVIAQPFDNHNGGCLKFGPDGYLYIGMGDGGGSGDPFNNAQSSDKLLGKMLRIDVDNGLPYTIPSGNPFINTPGYRDEIWALGLRNPWRFSFDRVSGDLWIGDVGQNLYEEVDYQAAGSAGGENYGWRCYEGNHVYNNNGCGAASEYIFPVVEYPHNPDCSITGGYVYRGTLYPNMAGKYFYTDYCSGNFRAVYNSGGTWQNDFLLTGLQYAYSTFGEDRKGEIYVASLVDGTIYHITDSSMPFDGKFAIESEATHRSMVIYPNPAHSDFTIQFSSIQKSVAAIEMINSLGQKVFEKDFKIVQGSNLLTIAVDDLAAGIYLIIMKSNGGKYAGKVIIE